MSWLPFFANVEIEGDGIEGSSTQNNEPFSWFPGRGSDGTNGDSETGLVYIGAGRFEIASDSDTGCCAGEEINDLDYRALVVKSAIRRAIAQGRRAPTTKDMAQAQREVDANLHKRDISRAYRL